jgi:hypothetical protein
MTRAQIQQVFFRKDGRLASVQAACRRLKLLSERGYLDRIRLPVTKGSGPHLYLPGTAADVVLDKDERELWGRRRRARRVESVAGFVHGLEVIDFYIALKEAMERWGGTLVTWLGEREARHQFVQNKKKLLLNPDGYCLWALGEEEGSFFLELDRGTESMTRFSQKLERYEAYYKIRAYHDHLGQVGLRPRLLIVVPDERRVEKLHKWISSRQEKRKLTSLPTVMVAAQDPVMADTMGPIWRVVGGQARVRLVD